MIDYEYLILNNSDADNTTDECTSCPYKGQCNNQCMQVEAIYNPYINKEQGGQTSGGKYCIISQHLNYLFQFIELNYKNSLEV